MRKFFFVLTIVTLAIGLLKNNLNCTEASITLIMICEYFPHKNQHTKSKKKSSKRTAELDLQAIYTNRNYYLYP